MNIDNVDLSNLTCKDLSELRREDIKRLTERLDEYNVSYINSAYSLGRISEYSRDCLLDLYGDSLGTYRAIYRAVYETFGSPICTASLDLESGEVEKDENGRDKDYTLKGLSPLVSSKIKFKDKNNNSIYVIFPKIKSVERSVEKISTEIDRDRQKSVEKIYNRYFDDENIDALRESLQDIPNSATQLKDVCRLTITCKYLSDVKRIKRMLTELGSHGKNPFFSIDASKTRDNFDIPLTDNKKRYFDIKMYMLVKLANDKQSTVEIQLKPEKIYKGHLLDHNLYEKKRVTEAQINGNATDAEKKIYGNLISYYENRIQKIRDASMHEYNMMVLDKVYRIEDTEYSPLDIAPDNKDSKTYNKCIKFIRDNFLVTSYAEFDADIFSPDKMTNKMSFLKIIGKIPENTDETYDKNMEFVNSEYDKLTHLERRRFKNIITVAKRYAFVIQEVINKRQREDSLKKTSLIKGKDRSL